MKKTNSPLRRLVLSPVGVTLLVSLIYLTVILFRAAGDPLEFARIGTRFSQADPAGTEGYDGQFVYYIALDPDPASVSEHLDVPAYRYQRILLPVLARILSGGSGELLPWVIPIISLTAHLVGVWLLADLLERWGVKRWYALVYGLWPGLLLALRLDLPEPLAFTLIIAAIWLHERKFAFPSYICFGLALFAKETTIFFVAAQLLAFLLQKRWREFVGLFLIAIIPFAIFRVWLWQQFGSLGFGLGGIEATSIEFIPFMGLWRVWAYNYIYFLGLAFVYLPAIILPVVWAIMTTVKRLLKQDWDFLVLALLANAAIFPFLPSSVYIPIGGTLRLATGLVLVTLLYAARYRSDRALRYIPFWLVLNAVLLQEWTQPTLN
jgi:hypothetical protein